MRKKIVLASLVCVFAVITITGCSGSSDLFIDNLMKGNQIIEVDNDVQNMVSDVMGESEDLDVKDILYQNESGSESEEISE